MDTCHFPSRIVVGLGLIAGMGFASLAVGQGASGDHGRIPFIVFSDDPGLKHSLGVRHEFPGKFTVALTLAQAHALNLSGIRTERVVVHHITPPPGACSPWPACKDDGGGSGGGSRIVMPDDQTPWGMETIYSNTDLAATSGGAGVNVAVLDTGVYKDHLDLKNRIQQCVDFTGGGPWTVRIKIDACDDGNGHGTHVAGTILADGGSDGLGIYGIAPEASLLAYRVCGSGGSCWSDDIAAAIDYAGTHEAHIVSMSLGGDSESTLIREAIARNSDLLFVAAAGNDGPSLGSIDYPGANVNVIAVGAIDSTMQVPNWSSRGVNDGNHVIEAREVELGAPGVSVESTWNNGGYFYLSGTSMATPHVSGLAAKVWQGNAASTRTHLQGLAVDISPAGDDPASGFGLPHM